VEHAFCVRVRVSPSPDVLSAPPPRPRVDRVCRPFLSFRCLSRTTPPSSAQQGRPAACCMSREHPKRSSLDRTRSKPVSRGAPIATPNPCFLHLLCSSRIAKRTFDHDMDREAGILWDRSVLSPSKYRIIGNMFCIRSYTKVLLAYHQGVFLLSGSLVSFRHEMCLFSFGVPCPCSPFRLLTRPSFSLSLETS